jgi:acyl-CoA synthetase (AMP-forming)/AMP-acid ligase II
MSARAVNIAAHLPARAHERPQTMAIIHPHGCDRHGRPRYRHYTFAELDHESNLLAAGLEQIGIRRGVRTVLMVPPSLDFYALTFALFKVGAVVVLIDPGMGMRNLGVCLKEAEPEAFVGVPKAHLARVVLGWARASLRCLVTVGRRLGWGGHTLAQVRYLGQTGARPAGTPVPPMAATQADETAAVLFTSGSTGVAKGAIYTHGIFAAQVDMLRRMYGIEPGEVDLPTFPLFGLFGPALGMTSVVPEMDPTRPAQVDPRKILANIHTFGVTNLFGSPALIQRVGRYAAPLVEEGGEVLLPTLRRVISAGAPVPASAIERFAALLAPGVQVHTPYGATEALPVCSIGSDEILTETRQQTVKGAGVCVGRPVAGMRVRIIRIDDGPLPEWSDDLLVTEGDSLAGARTPARRASEGEEDSLACASGLYGCAIGEIVVQGPVVTARYHNRPASTALAKIAHAEGICHRMGDLGYFDEQGRLWFCGRKSQRVQTAQGTLFTTPCEGVFNVHAGVYRTALVGVTRNGVTEPVLCVEREKECRLPETQLRQELLALGAAHAHTRTIRTILFHSGFPVDVRHNAKIFREKLTAWAAERT